MTKAKLAKLEAMKKIKAAYVQARLECDIKSYVVTVHKD